MNNFWILASVEIQVYLQKKLCRLMSITWRSKKSKMAWSFVKFFCSCKILHSVVVSAVAIAIVAQPVVGVEAVVDHGLVPTVQQPGAVITVTVAETQHGVGFAFLAVGHFLEFGGKVGLSGGHLGGVLDRLGSNTWKAEPSWHICDWNLDFKSSHLCPVLTIFHGPID